MWVMYRVICGQQIFSIYHVEVPHPTYVLNNFIQKKNTALVMMFIKDYLQNLRSVVILFCRTSQIPLTMNFFIVSPFNFRFSNKYLKDRLRVDFFLVFSETLNWKEGL